MPPRKKVLKQKQKQPQRQTVTVHINTPKPARKRKPRAAKKGGSVSGSGSSQSRVVAVPFLASNPNPSYSMYSAGDVNKFSSLIPQQITAAEPVAIKNEPIPHTFVQKPEQTIKEENLFYTNYKNEKKLIFNIYDEMDENPFMRDYLTSAHQKMQDEIVDKFTIDEMDDEKMAAGGGIEDENENF